MLQYGFFRVLVICFVTCILSGCSESPGGGGIGGTGSARTVTGTGIVAGPIEGFGSVIINNRRFETDHATILVDGKIGHLTDLRIGMSVTARVDYQRLEATTIVFQSLLAGPVESISTNGDRLQVLGQTILLSNETVLDEITITELTDRPVIEISGDRDAENAIVATYLRHATDPDTYHVVGQLEAPFEYGHQFELSGSIFDSIGLGNILPDSLLPIVGDTLKSTIDSKDYEQDNPTIVSVSLEVLEPITIEQNETVEINGVVSRVSIDGSFKIKGRNVSVDNQTSISFQQGTVPSENTIEKNDRINLIGVSLEDGSVLAKWILVRD